MKGALDYGLDAVFVTGGLSAAELGPHPDHPDPERLEGYLAVRAMAPQFAIGKLR